MEKALQAQTNSKKIDAQPDWDAALVDIPTAAMLTGISERTLRDRCSKGLYDIREVSSEKGGGSGGVSYRIPISSLPRDAQMRYCCMRDDHVLLTDLAAYHARYGDAGVSELWERLNAVHMFNQLESGDKRTVTQVKAEYAASIGKDARTVYRWCQRYQQEGIAGIMNSLARSGKGKPKALCLFAQDFIKHQLYCANKRYNAAIYAALCKLDRDLGVSACERCPHCDGSDGRTEAALSCELERNALCDQQGGGLIVPQNIATINRYIATIPEDELAYARRGNRYWEANYMHKTLRKKPEMVNECWFGDHHMFDLFVIDDNGDIVRPWLTAWSDAASGAFVAFGVNTCPNSTTVAETLKRGILPTKSGFSGVPKMIYIDNGKDYRSKKMEGDREVEYSLGRINEHFNDAGMLRNLGIAVIHAQPYKAWSKIIERLFGTLEGRYIRELPGWCGGRPDQRPEDLTRAKLEKMAARDELLTLRQFEQVVREQIIPAYHAERFGQLKSPLEIYQSLPKARGDMPSWDVLSLLSTEAATRKICTSGIKLQNRWYWHEALTHMVGQEVVIKYDKDDMAQIVVTQGKRYICVAPLAQVMKLVDADPIALAAHMAGQARARREVRANIAAAHNAVETALKNVIYEPIDLSTVKGGVTSTEYRRAAKDLEKTKAERREKNAAEKAADDLVRKRFMERGRELVNS